jgi:predicted enzyme related to lactoylglutathione lyase
VKINLTSIYVDDQDRALRFYTDIVGFIKKADVTQGPFRWLTVASSEEPGGTQLQLAMYEQSQPAVMFTSDDVHRDYDRMKALGAEFTMPPTKVTGSTIAMVNDTCGNLIQITTLDRREP